MPEVKPEIEEAQREGTRLTEAEQKGRITELAWTLKKANYAEETIRMVISALRTLIQKELTYPTQKASN